MLSTKGRDSGRSSQLVIKTDILEALATLVVRPKKDCDHLSYIWLSTRLRMFYFDTSLWLSFLYDSQVVGLFVRFLLRMFTVSGVPLEYGKVLSRQQEYLTPDTSAKADPNLGSLRQKDILFNPPPESIVSDVNNSFRPETNTIIVKEFLRNCRISSMRSHIQLTTTVILYIKYTTRNEDGGDDTYSLGLFFLRY